MLRLNSLMLKALVKDPRARYPSVRAFVEALRVARPAATPMPAGMSVSQPTPVVTAPAQDHPSAIPTGTLLYTWQKQTSAVYTAAWSPDGRRLASASNDETARVWWVGEGKQPE
jgi:hypothetical protein